MELIEASSLKVKPSKPLWSIASCTRVSVGVSLTFIPVNSRSKLLASVFDFCVR